MFYSLRARLKKQWFSFNARRILSTPPVSCDKDSAIVILSQLHHPDLIMYLVAAKSFSQYVRPKTFLIVDDGLLEEDKTLLRNHFQCIEFRKTRDVPLGACPRGGCWERLLGVADANELAYVIQLDSDTITMAPPNEVLKCVEDNRCFTMGTPGGNAIVGLQEASSAASRWRGNHVQKLAEEALCRLPPGLGESYVHGCAGFAGFAAGSLRRKKMYAFTDAMAQLVGNEKWAEWGSEQVTSNFMVANSPGATVLPVNHYPFWKRGVEIDEAKLVHFFGTHRFKHGQYLRSAKKVIGQIA